MKKLFGIFAICALAFAACEEEKVEPNPEPQPEPKPEPDKEVVFELTSQATMEFGAEGGTGEITFKLENPKDGASVVPECTATWITDLTADDSVTFTVAANDVEESRSATIVVKYDTKQFEVAVNQAAKQGEGPGPEPEPEVDVEFVAQAINGSYYPLGGINNYYIMLSDLGVPSESQVYLNSTIYYLDLYSSVAANGDEVYVPAGEYTFTTSGEGADGTFDQGYTYLIKSNDSDIEYMKVCVGGSVTVTENKIEAFLEIENPDGTADLHHIVYEGELLIGYPTQEQTPISTLENDLVIAVTDGIIMGENYGDEEGIGADYGVLYMYENLDMETEAVSGHCFMLELLLNNNGFPGRYISFEENEQYAGSFFPGEYEDYGEEGIMPYYCWYIQYNENSEPIAMAPITSGTITVKDNGDGTMTVEYDVFDDNDNKITGTFSGAAEIYDESEPMKASAKLATKSMTAKKSAAKSVVIR